MLFAIVYEFVTFRLCYMGLCNPMAMMLQTGLLPDCADRLFPID
jgi:hypothetical protein